MQSRRSSGVIDLRGGRSSKRPSRGQVPLFSPRTPEPPRRPMPLRARRRRIRALWTLGALLCLGALGYGVSWVSYLPQFNVSHISVAGAKGINEEIIQRSIETVLDDGSYHIISRRNIFLYPQKNIEETIARAFPPIKSVRVTRPAVLSTEVMVTIEEREPFARWCAYDGLRCYLMDANGFIYAPIGESTASTTLQTLPSSPYIFKGDIASSTEPVGRWFVQAHLPGLLSLLKFLGQAGFTVLSAEVENDQDIIVHLQEGFLLKASFGADASTLVKNLELVLSSEVLQGKTHSLEYVDLRFGNRVYYKLKGEKETSTQ